MTCQKKISWYMLHKPLFFYLSISGAANLYSLSAFVNTFLQFFLSIAESGGDSQEKEERSYGSLMMERLTGSEEGHIDHMLQVCCLPI